MPTYPLATLAPTISSAGITAPAYQDILSSLIASYTSIYGSDVYLGEDTQDYQWIAILAKALSDTNQAIIATYNQFSPATAIGAGLSSVVRTNGIERLVPSASTATVTIVGQAFSPLPSAPLIGDNQNLGTRWSLPSGIVIPSGGSVTATATCVTPGAVIAGANTLTEILTPTAGWQTVTNPAAAVVGNPVEDDPTLRTRQSVSTNLPAQTVLDSILGSILSVANVSSAKVYENPTGSTDGNGLPPWSICAVVDGGALQDIVNTIGLKKTAGIQTYGTTSGTYVDTYGVPHTISYDVASHETITVVVNIHALTGYTSQVATDIQSAVAAYVSALGIGQSILIGRLWVPANLQGPFASPATAAEITTYEVTSVLAAISPGTPGSSDVTLAFNQLAVCAPINVTVNVS